MVGRRGGAFGYVEEAGGLLRGGLKGRNAGIFFRGWEGCDLRNLIRSLKVKAEEERESWEEETQLDRTYPWKGSIAARFVPVESCICTLKFSSLINPPTSFPPPAF